MRELMTKIDKELKQIGEQGVNTSNLGMLGELVDIQKDLYEIDKMKKEEGGSMRDYGRGGYSRGGYNEGYGEYRMYDYGRGGYNERGYNEGGYGRRGGYGDGRMYEHIDQIYEGAERYQEGRDRYRHGDTEERMYDGLERLMYGICMLVETTADLAETPRAKEIIRKHLQKMKDV